MPKYKWTTLKHNGVLFPPEYVKHDIPIKYKGQEVILDDLAEEYATLYAKFIDTDYVTNSTFNKNFWKDWRKVLGKDHLISELDSCNFDDIYQWLIDQKEEKKNADTEEKEEKKQIDEKYKIALVDGKEQPVGNFRVEPPGIFLGRGCNPKLGKIKQRIYASDITINIGKGEKIPKASDGREWGEVIHNREVEWLASWKDNINGKIKYVWLGAQSEMKGKSDMAKFDNARKLKRKIKTIRKENDLNLDNDNIYIQQVATALYFIDRFALRVGNEKGSDETDTVGVTSLRVEHIKFKNDNVIGLDFLGKDSVRYKRDLVVDKKVYNNMENFVSKKSDDDEVFDQINSNDINKYLQSFMKDLTAKVFRTFNASSLFQKELLKTGQKFIDYEEDDKINLLLDDYNKANAKVAMLCNHQKNVNKSTATQIDKIKEQIKKANKQLNKARKANKPNQDRISKIRDKIKKLKAKKSMKVEMKNISLGTSKINYIDPRITVAFCKKFEVPIEKVFNAALIDKFKWALGTSEEFIF